MSDDKGNDSEQAKDSTKRWPWLVAVIVGIAIFALPLIFAFSNPIKADEYKFSSLGEFGDFVGGLANPLLAFFGYLALLYTIYLQHSQLELSRRELKLSREELALTRDELERSATALEAQTKHLDKQNLSKGFFDLFQMYRSVVTEIEIDDMNHQGQIVQITGKSALQNLADKFYRGWGAQIWQLDKVLQTHTDLNSGLGNYFRLIYRMFIFLNEAGPDGKFYADMFRAQLTTSELYLLFYNCISDVGRPMMTYAVEFELFDNMPLPGGKNFELIVKELDPRSFGKNAKLIELYELAVSSE